MSLRQDHASSGKPCSNRMQGRSRLSKPASSIWIRRPLMSGTKRARIPDGRMSASNGDCAVMVPSDASRMMQRRKRGRKYVGLRRRRWREPGVVRVAVGIRGERGVATRRADPIPPALRAIDGSCFHGTSLPGRPLPQGSLPKDPLPQDPLPQDPLPKDPLPQDPLPQGPLPQGPLPQGPLPRDPLPGRRLPQGSLPHDPLSQGPSPRER